VKEWYAPGWNHNLYITLQLPAWISKPTSTWQLNWCLTFLQMVTRAHSVFSAANSSLGRAAIYLPYLRMISKKPSWQFRPPDDQLPVNHHKTIEASTGHHRAKHIFRELHVKRKPHRPWRKHARETFYVKVAHNCHFVHQTGKSSAVTKNWLDWNKE